MSVKSTSPQKNVFVNQDKMMCLLIQEMQLRSLGQEDLMVKEMATQSSIFAWEIPWTEEWAMVHGFTRVGYNLVNKQHHQ